MQLLRLALAIVTCLACTTAGGWAAAKPNIIFVLADQWRASATAYAGDPNVKTPELDRLASQGFRFDNAVSVCPVCTPYRAALQPASAG